MLKTLLPTNVGALDQGVRVVLGLVLLALVFVGPHTAWGWLGLVFLATAGLRSCPLYTLLGIGTARATAAPRTR